MIKQWNTWTTVDQRYRSNWNITQLQNPSFLQRSKVSEFVSYEAKQAWILHLKNSFPKKSRFLYFTGDAISFCFHSTKVNLELHEKTQGIRSTAKNYFHFKLYHVFFSSLLFLSNLIKNLETRRRWQLHLAC